MQRAKVDTCETLLVYLKKWTMVQSFRMLNPLSTPPNSKSTLMTYQYTSSLEAADIFLKQLQQHHPNLQIELVGGDMTLPQTRRYSFQCFNTCLVHADLCLMVHNNAGQICGLTFDNSHGIQAPGGPSGKRFRDGSLLQSTDTITSTATTHQSWPKPT